MARNSEIISALFDHLDDLSGWTGKIAFPEYKPGTFNVPADGKWLEARIFPNKPRFSGMEGDDLKQGFLQVNVNWPPGKGIIAPTLVVDAIIDHFPNARRLVNGTSSVKIDQKPWMDVVTSGDNGVVLQVTIPYSA